MGWIRILCVAPILLLAIPTLGNDAIDSTPRRLEGTRESEIQLFLENEIFPLDAIKSSVAREFFEELESISGFNFILDSSIDGSFLQVSKNDVTYLEFFENVLPENGFMWRRQPGTNLIWISPDSMTQRFSLTSEQRRRLKQIIRSNPNDKDGLILRSRILGTMKSRGVTPKTTRYELSGSDLVVTDSQSNMRRVKRYLDRLHPERPRSLERTQRTLGKALYGNQSIEEAAAEGRARVPGWCHD